MVGHSSLFSQLLLLVNRHQFARRVKECCAEKAAKGFGCWSQFVAMMFCQLAQAKSLREIIDGLACCEGKLNHLGLQEVYFPRKNGHECVWFFSLVIEAEGYAAVKVASRHKRPPSRAERGPLPFIPFARLTFAPPSAQRVAVTFSFEKVVLFSG